MRKKFEGNFTLKAVDDDKWVFDVRSRIESQQNSQNPCDPHDNCQFRHYQGQASLVCTCSTSLNQQKIETRLVKGIYLLGND